MRHRINDVIDPVAIRQTLSFSRDNTAHRRTPRHRRRRYRKLTATTMLAAIVVHRPPGGIRALRLHHLCSVAAHIQVPRSGINVRSFSSMSYMTCITGSVSTMSGCRAPAEHGFIVSLKTSQASEPHMSSVTRYPPRMRYSRSRAHSASDSPPPAGLRRIKSTDNRKDFSSVSFTCPGIARVDAREPLDSRGEMVVRIRPIDDPPPRPLPVARRVAEAPVIVRRIGVLQTNEN